MSYNSPPRPNWTLVVRDDLTPAQQAYDAPWERRMAGWIKSGLRRFGIRLVSVGPVEPPPQKESAP